MKFNVSSDQAICRRGLSIIELMIAITISLIVLVVMMQAFRRASGEIKKGRAMIEMASEMRAVGETFRRDLANATVSPRVWNLNSECDGYFEIVEGAQHDGTYPGMGTDTLDNDGDAAVDEPDEQQMSVSYGCMGDMDDVIALTVRSGEKPFRGRWVDAGGNTQIVESHVAEIVWFTVREDIDEANGIMDLDDRVTLYRRVLLVRPDLLLQGTSANMTAYYLDNDISARPVDPAGGATPVANTLSDLTLRENRYAHDSNPATYPHWLQNGPPRNNNWLADRRLANGEDILLTNLAGFDIRVYSPNGPNKTPNDTQFLGPNDPNYATNTANATGEGSYVDLGWSRGVTGTSWFEEVSAIDRPPSPITPSTWDSWSPHYEYNGIDDDDGGTGPIDEGTNGLDDNGDLIVDDADEREAPAPYAHPLRAVELKMRGIEKSTRNVRQVTINSSFVPE